MIDKDALAAKVHAYGVAGTAKPEIVERRPADSRNSRAMKSSRETRARELREDLRQRIIRPPSCCSHGL